MIESTYAVLIGSKGRDSLRFTLDSFARQDRRPGDRCIVAFDALDKTDLELERLRALVASYGDGFLSVAYDSGYHWLGVEQINYSMRQNLHARSSHVFTLGDDDIFVDDAFATLRPWTDALPLRPILFRFLAPWRAVLWDKPRLKSSHISGCCIAAPTPFVAEMTTEKIVTHDYCWIVDVVRKSGVDPVWLDELLVVARPDPIDGRLDDVKHDRFYRLGADAWIQRDNLERYK